MTIKPSGPPVPVFVGNITERASDQLIRQLFAVSTFLFFDESVEFNFEVFILLKKCGQIGHWKRVQGANGKWQGFGYCDYVFEESALRAVRLLHNLQVADKKLVVKVDPKYLDKLEKEESKQPTEKTNVDENKQEKLGKKDGQSAKEQTKNGGKGDDIVADDGKKSKEELNSDFQNGTLDSKNFLDEETLKEDTKVIEEIQRLLAEGRFDQKQSKAEMIKDQDSPKMDGPKPDVSPLSRIIFLFS